MHKGDVEIIKVYIRQRRFDEARNILLTMPNDKSAQELLAKLNRIEFGQEQNFSHSRNPVVIHQTIQQVNSNSNVSANRGCFSEIPGIALALIVLNMALWGGLTVVSAFATSPEAGIGAFFGVILFFGISFVLSYLYWKFYWWMLALSWTALSLFTLCSLMYAIQAPSF